jgi:uncharacterized protein YjbI with pentapeptide repeats
MRKPVIFLLDYWFPVILVLLLASMFAVFFRLLPDGTIDWNTKGDIGNFIGGFFNGITFIVFALSLWLQRREIAGQQENLQQTRREMIQQTQFLQRQAEVQKEQLAQLKLEEVLANIRLLADNVVELGAPKDGVPHEAWKSQTITQLARSNLTILRKFSLEALQSLRVSDRPILKTFAEETIAGFKGNLRGAEVREANLEGIQLDNAFLVEADLSGSNLRNALFLGANLSHADLSRANLDGADLGGAHLINANLERANLLGASLMEVNLTGANLEQAILTGADFDHALVDPKWRTFIERSGVKNGDKIQWVNGRG